MFPLFYCFSQGKVNFFWENLTLIIWCEKKWNFDDLQYFAELKIKFLTTLVEGGNYHLVNVIIIWHYSTLSENEGEFTPIYEIRMGSYAKSHMSQGFLIYEEKRKHSVTYVQLCMDYFATVHRHQSKMSSSKKITCKGTLWQVFIKV